MKYRTVQKTSIYHNKPETYESMGIWADEGKGGEPKEGYQDCIWSLFAFEVIPTPSEAVLDWVEENEYTGNLIVVDGVTVRIKTIEELENE